MSDQGRLEAGTPVEIVARYAFETPCVGEKGKIAKLTEPRMMALVLIDGSSEPRTFWVEELQALPATKEEVCT